MKKVNLEIIVLICGATVMIYELVGSRMLAPYLGTSLIVWTNLIGIILGSLSLGYWWGGKVSDHKPDSRVLSSIIFVAGVLIGLTTYIYYDVLFIIDRVIQNYVFKSVISTILLFALPSILLGMVSPYAVKLKSQDLNNIGKAVGNLYAISTIGSIIGTFVAGFFLIPQFGTNKILILLSALLIFASILCLRKEHLKEKITFVTLFVLIMYSCHGLHTKYFLADYLVDTDTQYSRVQIEDVSLSWIIKKPPKGEGANRNNTARFMKLNGLMSTGIFLDKPELMVEYTKYFRLAKHFKPGLKRSLMIGGAGYAYPIDYLSKFNDSYIDVVEIDRKITELAATYFNLKMNKRLKIFHEDGRTFINSTSMRYDVIFNDAFSSYFSIPYQLTTREAVKKMYNLLNDGGVAIVNIISSVTGNKGKFLRSEYATFKNVFPQVYLFPVQEPVNGYSVQNIMLVALKTEKKPAFVSRNPELNNYLRHLWVKEIEDDTPILTDEYAPVDYYISKIIL